MKAMSVCVSLDKNRQVNIALGKSKSNEKGAISRSLFETYFSSKKERIEETFS